MRVLILLLIVLLLAACAPIQQSSVLEKTSGALTVRIHNLSDGAQVSTPEIEVTGEAPIDTVVTVNEDIIVVGREETFTSTVMLEEGPNLIEIIASNAQGDEISFILSITYQP